MEDLTHTPQGDEPFVLSIDPTDDLARVIRLLVANRDARHELVDPDDIVGEIETKHQGVLLSRGKALARKQCRRMVTNYLRRIAAMDPEKDGPQISLPGLERLPSHISFEIEIKGTEEGRATEEGDAASKPRKKIVDMNTRDATRAQHFGCLLLKRMNSQRCLAREAQQERIVDLLDSTGCDSLQEWQDRFGQGVA